MLRASISASPSAPPTTIPSAGEEDQAGKTPANAKQAVLWTPYYNGETKWGWVLPFPFPLVPTFHRVGLPDYRGNSHFHFHSRVSHLNRLWTALADQYQDWKGRDRFAELYLCSLYARRSIHCLLVHEEYWDWCGRRIWRLTHVVVSLPNISRFPFTVATVQYMSLKAPADHFQLINGV